jgi:alkanesulfonate monooxygenase SsuD/methylene tetrahydromethanopterin reductase-like flavin-dependent oxidoreductase (luciferase family)
MVATLDVITNGRIELGIGAGWYEEEYKSYGYTYFSDIVRILQLQESIQIIKKLWTQKIETSVENIIILTMLSVFQSLFRNLIPRLWLGRW